MDNHEEETKHAVAQSRAGEAGANLTDVLAAGTYTLKLKADSGYEAEETGRITPEQWGAALAVFDDAKFGAMVYKMATGEVANDVIQGPRSGPAGMDG